MLYSCAPLFQAQQQLQQVQQTPQNFTQLVPPEFYNTSQ